MDVAQQLKGMALVELRRDAHRAEQLASLIVQLGETLGLGRVKALGLQATGTLQTLAYRDYEKALGFFKEATDLFKDAGDELNMAITQVTRVWALACLQRYDEAFATGAWTAEIFRRHGAHRPLAALSNNLAITHSRRGDDAGALKQLDAVIEAYRATGPAGAPHVPFALINRSIALRNLGRFQASIDANLEALALANDLGQTDTSARARQNLGITYFTQGRLTEAHALLEEAREMFLVDNRLRDAILADLYISDGLLQLRRYDDVIEKCRQVRETFGESGIGFEVAQAWLNEATALTGLGHYEAAETALAAAQSIFKKEENLTWQLYTDLEQTASWLAQGRYERAGSLAQSIIDRLAQLDLPLKEAQAYLLLGQTHFHLHAYKAAADALNVVLQIEAAREVPALLYQVHYWRGRISEMEQQPAVALAAYDAAIRQLEQLQGQIMVEFRADFLVDKQVVYEAAVSLCLESGSPAAALQMAERSRSRALLDLITHRVDMRLEVRSPHDQPLVDELVRLQEERNRLLRYWDSREIPGDGDSGTAAADDRARGKLRRQTVQVEKEIKKMWHQLLIRNAAYGREAALFQVTPSQPLPVPPANTALLEFFVLEGRLIAFVIVGSEVTARPLPLSLTVLGKLQQTLKHQFGTVSRMPAQAALLLPKAQVVLRQLYDGLIAPLTDLLIDQTHLIIVPQGELHYIPWAALFDGQQYLLHRWEITILPAASLLNEIDDPVSESDGLSVCLMGHTRNGQLPQIAAEIEAISALTGGSPYLDETVTRAAFMTVAPQSTLIHLATHGEFRHTEPLFSGLQMADGLLTTLDIFNMRLRAALVNLSACQTGRAVVGGGDELFGLMRAFLAAGAGALVMSLWRVNDHSTATLMETFYERLMAGCGRGEALRYAQLDLLDHQGGRYAHPYFWAPFFLVGQSSPLPNLLA